MPPNGCLPPAPSHMPQGIVLIAQDVQLLYQLDCLSCELFEGTFIGNRAKEKANIFKRAFQEASFVTGVGTSALSLEKVGQIVATTFLKKNSRQKEA